MSFDPPVPGFIFTDNPDLEISAEGWTVVLVAGDEDAGTIPGGRISTKRLKFLGHFPPALRPYRYLIHLDTSQRTFKRAIKAFKNNIMGYARSHPQYFWFGRHHPFHNTMEEEIQAIMSKPKLQSTDSLEMWKEYLGHEHRMEDSSKSPLPETNFWILDTDNLGFVCAWKGVFDTVVEHDLWRDQLAWNYAMRNYGDQLHFCIS